MAILADPGVYYVNVHTDEFPDGAVRGQLEGGTVAGGDSDPEAEGEELAATGSSLALLLLLVGLTLVGAGTLLHRTPGYEDG